MKLEELKLLNDEELKVFAQESISNAMLVGRHYRWLYKHKIETLKRAGREDLIPIYEKKLEELNSGNKDKSGQGEPDPAGSVSEKTKRNRQKPKTKVELPSTKVGDLA